MRSGASVRLGGREIAITRRRSGVSACSRRTGARSCTQWMQLGPGRSGLSLAIERMPEQGAEDRVRADARIRAEHERNPGAHQEVGGRLMRTATHRRDIGPPRRPWREQADFVIEADRLGLDICWVAEAWGSDAPSALGYYAARTQRMLLGSGVMQVGTGPRRRSRRPRSRCRTCRAAGSCSAWARPARRSSRACTACRSRGRWPGCARPWRSCARRSTAARSTSAGTEFRIPRPAATPCRCGCHARPSTPSRSISPTLSPAMLRLTGEVADGWLGTSFVPEARTAPTSRTSTRAWPRAAVPARDLDICQGAEVAFADDEDVVAVMVAARKKELAFSLGGMGSQVHQLLQPGLQPAGLGRGRGRGPRAVAGGRSRRGGRAW